MGFNVSDSAQVVCARLKHGRISAGSSDCHRPFATLTPDLADPTADATKYWKCRSRKNQRNDIFCKPAAIFCNEVVNCDVAAAGVRFVVH